MSLAQAQNLEHHGRKPRRVSLKAEIMTGKYYPVIQCMVQDCSENGARLQLPVPTDLPSDFRIRMFKTGEIKYVRTIWRAAQSIGVIFHHPPVRTSKGAEGGPLQIKGCH